MKLLYPLIILFACSTEPKTLGVVGVWEVIEKKFSETDSYELINDINSEYYDSTAFNRFILFPDGNYSYEDYNSTLHSISWGEYSVYNYSFTLFANYRYVYDSENIPPSEDSTYVLNDIIEYDIIKLTDDELILEGILGNVYDSYYSAIFRRIE